MTIWQRGLAFLLAIFSPQTSLPPFPKVQVDYEFTEIILAEELVNAVKILKGDFENVVYYYGWVKIIPDNEVNKLAYQYTLWDTAGRTKKELTESTKFTTHIGDILVTIIADGKNEGEYYSPTKEQDVI